MSTRVSERINRPIEIYTPLFILTFILLAAVAVFFKLTSKPVRGWFLLANSHRRQHALFKK